MKLRIIDTIKRIKSNLTIDDNSHLILDGMLSSLEIIMLIKELEEEFTVKIPVSEVVPDNFDTVDSIVKMVERLKA